MTFLTFFDFFRTVMEFSVCLIGSEVWGRTFPPGEGEGVSMPIAGGGGGPPRPSAGGGGGGGGPADAGALLLLGGGGGGTYIFVCRWWG